MWSIFHSFCFRRCTRAHYRAWKSAFFGHTKTTLTYERFLNHSAGGQTAYSRGPVSHANSRFVTFQNLCALSRDIECQALPLVSDLNPLLSLRFPPGTGRPAEQGHTSIAIVDNIFEILAQTQNKSRRILTMAPRQRNNISASSTPTSSEDESCSHDVAANSAPQEKSGSNAKASKAKPTQPKTLSITEADIARDNHDYFNIVALAVVVYTCALNHEYPSLSYTGEHFWTMWAVSWTILNSTSKVEWHCRFAVRCVQMHSCSFSIRGR